MGLGWVSWGGSDEGRRGGIRGRLLEDGVSIIQGEWGSSGRKYLIVQMPWRRSRVRRCSWGLRQLDECVTCLSETDFSLPPMTATLPN